MTQAIVVGVGQQTFRFGSLDEFVNPIEGMRQVVELAAQDAGAPRLAREADSLHVVNMLSWTSRDAPTSLADALGAKPSLKEYTAVGGNSPQWLVHRAADNLVAGRSRIAILAGCEVMSSLRRAAKEGRDLGSFRESVGIPLVGTQKRGTLEVEMAHGADLPVRIYPLIENALRFKEGLSIAEHRRRLGRFGEACCRTAAANPLAWHRTPRTAEEIVTASPTNRMLGFPYTRYLNAEIYVDQAAAVILTTPQAARQFGVPESKWVYLHGGQDAEDLWYVSERDDLASSPAIQACVNDALGQADMGLEEVQFFDFYSCFPCVPRLTQRVLAIPEDDPRPITLTGGLPFFGGPGNNYVMHAIAEAVQRCRQRPHEVGMVTANGYYSTKHSIGLYGAQPPKRAWSRTSPEAFQESIRLPEPMTLDPSPTGPFRVDAYTVWHDRSGEPEYGLLCGRTDAGQRAWGRTVPGNGDVLREMMSTEWVGRIGRVAGKEGGVNFVEF